MPRLLFREDVTHWADRQHVGTASTTEIGQAHLDSATSNRRVLARPLHYNNPEQQKEFPPLLASIRGRRKFKRCRGRNDRGEKEESDMKIVLLFAAAATIVALMKGIMRNSKDESDSQWGHLLARPGRKQA